MREWKVAKEENGKKLVNFLVEHLENRYSANFLKKIIEKNNCRVNGQVERFASTIVGEGDRVLIHIDEKDNSPPRLFQKERVLFEDDALLIYNKPPGVNCDPRGILDLLSSYQLNLQLVHRLDKETTGSLLLAKDLSLKQKLIEQFRTYQVRKRYLALVDGKVKKEKGIIENHLGKLKEYSGQSLWGAVDKKKGGYACTEWKKLKTGSYASLIECYPKTGRTHQIRVHMASLGHPLIGDFQYGKDFKCQEIPPRILLHAETLWFNHPNTCKPLCVSAPIPNDFISFQAKTIEESI